MSNTNERDAVSVSKIKEIMIPIRNEKRKKEPSDVDGIDFLTGIIGSASLIVDFCSQDSKKYPKTIKGFERYISENHQRFISPDFGDE